MSITSGPNLGLMVNGNAGEAHYTEFMRLLRGLDALVMPVVKGYLTNTPPGSPSDGDLYILGAATTGAWAGQEGKVARWSSVASAWEFYTPKNGWMLQASSARESYRYTSGSWGIYYQEGTWTPAITGRTTAGSNTYGHQAGTYVKISNLVIAPFRLYMSAKDASIAGALDISGLPFVPVTHYGGCSVGYMYGFTLGAGSQLSLWPGGATAGQAKAAICRSGASNGSMMAADLASVSELYGVLIYHT